MTAYDLTGHQQTLSGSWFITNPTGIAHDPRNQWLYVAEEFPADQQPGVMAFGEQRHAQALGTRPFVGLVSPVGITYDPHQDGFYVSDLESGHNFLSLFDPLGKRLSTNALANLATPQFTAIVP